MTKKIIVVCFANYCRSPVAEKILQYKFSNLHFESYGLNPLVEPNMDQRSREFLQNENVNYKNHIPRKINREIIEKSSLVLCMDHFILMNLNKLFPSAVNKLKIFTFKNSEMIIEDPYKFNQKNYQEVMKKILIVCNNFQESDFE